MSEKTPKLQRKKPWLVISKKTGKVVDMTAYTMDRVVGIRFINKRLEHDVYRDHLNKDGWHLGSERIR